MAAGRLARFARNQGLKLNCLVMFSKNVQECSFFYVFKQYCATQLKQEYYWPMGLRAESVGIANGLLYNFKLLDYIN